MWLLCTRTAELKSFARPEDVPGGYAILSHVWEPPGKEDTFQRILDLEKQAESPRDLVSPKIRQFLTFAEKDGYSWAWADTCCIDKESSAQLTEAINSMFRYYALADVCYAYLSDVTAENWDVMSLTTIATFFETSKWHGRGWTLQELIAPKTVLFFAVDWTPLGTKFELAKSLEAATGIPQAVLRMEMDVTEISIAARMSWAARRKTTRVEDEAYSLFGLFGINLPTLYGEGQNAFYRLQEGIMKTSADTSLFAWGPAASSMDLKFDIDFRVRRNQAVSIAKEDPRVHLFAPSPSHFRDAGNIMSHTLSHTVDGFSGVAQVSSVPIEALSRSNI
ncbi:HET-domain-containing protein [Epithele typhae]|uniref:HET-domain-containing protein n=1 Tax=Epithele typhae TaxID=378194 RepID=UPI002007A584|nr:HET-domain-containing protein [Epithele typhae]KAH9914372.1 HET-domain-containing protein [Epithele typhae]